MEQVLPTGAAMKVIGWLVEGLPGFVVIDHG